MIRAIGPALVGLLAGCQLVVGEIELRSEQRGDAHAVDAAPEDAAPVDAAAPDARPPDAHLDATTDPDAAMADARADAAPDAMPDAAPQPPTVDLTALVGTWHVYGVQGRDRALSLFDAALRVSADGMATVTEIGNNTPLAEVETPFEPHPDGSGRIAVNLFPVAGLLAGTLDPESGVGVLVNDADRMSTQPIFAMAVRRVQPRPDWPQTALYAHLVVRPQPGVGELGILTGVDEESVSQSLRVLVDERGPVAGEPRQLSRGAASNGRVRFDVDGAIESHVLSPADGTGGFGGMIRAGGAVGLTFAWTTGPGTIARAVSMYCGGVRFDENNRFVVERSFAELSPELAISFEDGRRAQLRPGEGLLRLDSERNFFHQRGGTATIDAANRVMLLIDGDLSDEDGRWGAGLCVSLAPGGD